MTVEVLRFICLLLAAWALACGNWTMGLALIFFAVIIY